MDPDPTLCIVCSGIDFTQYFQRAIDSQVLATGFVGPTKEALKLGSLAAVLERGSHCAFCRLVGKNTRRLTTREDHPKDIGCWIYSYLYATNRPKEAKSEAAYRIGIATRLERRGTGEARVVDIQLLADDAMRLGMTELFHGRLISPGEMDMQLARSWLNLCEHDHGKLCGVDAQALRPQDLLVIDVKRLCLCLLHPESRYLALSYCWPAVKPYMLTESVKAELLEPGSLERRMQELPAAIQDAISCTSELGESYLWIDSLCIIQDSDEDKESKISQMDRIYSSAFVTLIAAGGTQLHRLDRRPADRGFPRYRHGLDRGLQEVEMVKGLRLANAMTHVMFAMYSSRWSYRCWTLQEGLLSPRLLCFTDTQVYFQCTCSVFCEDAAGEGNHPSAYISPGTNLFHLGSPHATRGSDENMGTNYLRRSPYPDFKWALVFGDYANFVEDYTLRNLSDDSDILNAFRGLENILKQSMQTDFWYGLPEARLVSALTWVLSRGHQRRKISVKGWPRPCFPSWTWLGWAQPVSWSSYIHGTRFRREIEWFLINEKDEALWMKTRDLPKDELDDFNQNDHQKVTPQGYEIARPPSGRVVRKIDIDSSHDDWRYPRYLACWTNVATLCISGETIHTPLMTAPGMIHLKVTTSDQAWVGSIMMAKEWVEDPHQSSLEFEFMLMSRTKGLVNTPDQAYTYFDEDLFRNRPWCMLHVMMIERREDTASRLGVGVVHEDGWSTIKKLETMFIKLE